MSLHRLAFVAAVRAFACTTCLAASAISQVEPSGAADSRLRLVVTPTRRLQAKLELAFEDFAGTVVVARPPDTCSQQVLRHELRIDLEQKTAVAEAGKDRGPLRKPVLEATVARRGNGKVVVELDMQMSTARLEHGNATTNVALLSKNERKALLASEWHYEHDSRGFRQWLHSNGLQRKRKETDRDFALRALEDIRASFVYRIPDPAQMQRRIAELKTDELGYFLAEGAGECWALSRIYTSILRANDVACRQVSGFMLDNQAAKVGMHHVRAEVHLDGIGWILVEVAGAVNGKGRPTGEFFGCAGDDMLLMCQGINYVLPGPVDGGNVGTFSSLALCDLARGWTFPGGNWLPLKWE
jgi:hypothetical protein